MHRSIIKLLSIWLLGLLLLFNIPLTAHGNSFEEYSWISLGSVEGGVSVGILGFKNKNNTAMEVGMIYTLEEDEDHAYGFDLYKFKDFSSCTIFGSLGYYLVRHSKYDEMEDFYYYESERQIAYSIGIQYDFSKFDIGFGYHSVRGPSIQLQFVKSPRAKSSGSESQE